MINLLLLIGIMLATLQGALTQQLSVPVVGLLLIGQVFFLAAGRSALRTAIGVGLGAYLFYQRFLSGGNGQDLGQALWGLAALLVFLIGYYIMFRGPFTRRTETRS